MALRSRVPRSIRHSPLAETLSRKELTRLDEIGTPLAIGPGEQIIQEATPGRECFIVIEGSFDVISDERIGSVSAGDVVGELALLTGRRRNASVMAATDDAAVYALHPREFSTLLRDAPRFRENVLKSARHRLRGQDVVLSAQLLPGHEARSA